MRLEDEISQPVFSSEYHKLAVNILYTHGWLVSLLNAELKPYGLTITQFNILRILRGQLPNPATVSLLRDRMLDKMPDVSRLVERLRAKGLVERAEDPGDRRRVAVRISDEGLALLERIGNFEEVMEHIAERVSLERAEMVSAALDDMRDESRHR